jgi:hypothetical protein
MKIPHMSKTAKIVVVVVVLVSFAALIMVIRSVLQRSASLTKVEVREVQPPPPQPIPEAKPMGKVRIEMERVLTKWCDVEAPFDDAKKLKDLWMRRFPTTPKYRPKGINRLIKRIHENELFGKCDPPHIEPGSFVDGGAIQKVGDLHNFLTPCEPED